MKLFQLFIISPDAVLFDAKVNHISVPGSQGYLGILADHQPLITTLKPGDFRISKPGSPTITFKTSFNGLLEISSSKVSVLLGAEDNQIGLKLKES